MARRPGLLALCFVLLFALAGCGANEADDPEREPGRAQANPPELTESPALPPPRCPSDVAECRETEGRIIYVERVDPDGDGDAHFVIADLQSITLPGATAIDVRKGLRPHPLPGPGDLVSAAGPVQTGSYGQRQIHALEFNVAP